MRVHAIRRWAALAAGVTLLGLTQTLAAPAAPAAAPPALARSSVQSLTDSLSPKTAIATCPAGKRVVGGGGLVGGASSADRRKLVLTRLEPVSAGGVDTYVVTAEEVAPGVSGTWHVSAYVLCAPELTDYQIVAGSTSPSSTATQQAVAECPGTTRTLGTGAQINNPGGGQVTLQLNRTDDALNIVRAVAKEDASGYLANWNVTSYAVCATLPATFEVVGEGTLTNTLETKTIPVTCPQGKYVHSAGVATSGTPAGLTTTPPGVAVQTAIPLLGFTEVSVTASATSTTFVAWDVAAFAICGP